MKSYELRKSLKTGWEYREVWYLPDNAIDDPERVCIAETCEDADLIKKALENLLTERTN